jgi:hypothetical protein
MALGCIQTETYTFSLSLESSHVKVAPPLDMFEEGYKLWQSTIVSHFEGQKLPFPVVNSIAIKI